jgi:hypothetical protein
MTSGYIHKTHRHTQQFLQVKTNTELFLPKGWSRVSFYERIRTGPGSLPTLPVFFCGVGGFLHPMPFFEGATGTEHAPESVAEK